MPDREDDMSIAPLTETERPDTETAEAESPELEPVPDWIIPSSDGFTAEDLDRLREIPSHTELIDGTLVFVSPRTRFHSLVMFLLERELRHTAPAVPAYSLRERSIGGCSSTAGPRR